MIHPIENWRTYDDNGVMMPWLTRSCLEWLDSFVKPGMKVFEYGCGSSSLWYHSRGAQLSGVDHNHEWLFFLPQYDDDRCRSEQECIGDKKSYTECASLIYGSHLVDQYGFDIIIIDGLYRDDCTEHALKSLKKGGYLICDNFEQPSADLAHWPKTRELTKHLPITIYKEPGHEDWQTAVWQK